MKRITILRHGEPDQLKWDKLYSSEMPKWIKTYNSSGIKKTVSLSCQRMLGENKHKFIICSNLARSIHSAEIIGHQSPNMIDAIFREAELEEIRIPFIRLTPHAWSMIFRLFWFANITKKVESLGEFKQRLKLAVELLIQLAQKHDSILFIGHGIINRFLAKELIRKGWSCEITSNHKKYYGYRYWEYATYTKLS